MKKRLYWFLILGVLAFFMIAASDELTSVIIWRLDEIRLFNTDTGCYVTGLIREAEAHTFGLYDSDDTIVFYGPYWRAVRLLIVGWCG